MFSFYEQSSFFLRLHNSDGTRTGLKATGELDSRVMNATQRSIPDVWFWRVFRRLSCKCLSSAKWRHVDRCICTNVSHKLGFHSQDSPRRRILHRDWRQKTSPESSKFERRRDPGQWKFNQNRCDKLISYTCHTDIGTTQLSDRLWCMAQWVKYISGFVHVCCRQDLWRSQVDDWFKRIIASRYVTHIFGHILYATW